MQIISFVDILLSHTVARSVLCIVPINTIQNWMAEFNFWLPEEDEVSYFILPQTVLSWSNTYLHLCRQVSNLY